MELAGPITLTLFLLMLDGQVKTFTRPQANSDTCWEAAKAFTLKRPADFQAIALGAGCMMHPDGKTSQKEERYP